MTEKTNLEDIIGIVKTDEPTDSVEEVRKLRGRETECERLKNENEALKKEIENNIKAFNENNHKRFKLDSEVGFIDSKRCGGDTMTYFEVVVELNKLYEENEQLKSENKELMELVQHCYKNWSDEKKKTVGDILNGLLGDEND